MPEYIIPHFTAMNVIVLMCTHEAHSSLCLILYKTSNFCIICKLNSEYSKIPIINLCQNSAVVPLLSLGEHHCRPLSSLINFQQPMPENLVSKRNNGGRTSGSSSICGSKNCRSPFQVKNLDQD